ncbi:hypothetical protein [Streptomyces noursei]|uniref:hypothetical protein n=1 Tax=Streptomyces noursei TaxID=1971 RepID=UPI001676D779|nr:hypothetical protein [Streptomyces noursei]MCZ1012966.1 hypothetical protein [Streptomyces noursei]GGX42689.1 hypothetical protein GCM10010341_75710 [Streptomyces noursei]
MTSYDAQAALDAIHHHQQQTRDEYVRHASSGTYGLIAALSVFATGSSIDLPSPWSLIARLVGGGLIAGGLVVQCRQARVHKKTSVAGALFSLWVAAVVIAVFVASVIAARLAHLPNPSVLAAAVAAVATLVATYATRPLVMRIAKRNNQG